MLERFVAGGGVRLGKAVEKLAEIDALDLLDDFAEMVEVAGERRRGREHGEMKGERGDALRESPTGGLQPNEDGGQAVCEGCLRRVGCAYEAVREVEVADGAAFRVARDVFVAERGPLSRNSCVSRYE